LIVQHDKELLVYNLYCNKQGAQPHCA